MLSNNLRGYLTEEFPVNVMIKKKPGVIVALRKAGFQVKNNIGRHINVLAKDNVDVCAIEAIAANVARR